MEILGIIIVVAFATTACWEMYLTTKRRQHAIESAKEVLLSGKSLEEMPEELSEAFRELEEQFPEGDDA